MTYQTMTIHSPMATKFNGVVAAMQAIAAHLKENDGVERNFDWVDEDIHEPGSSDTWRLV